MTVLFQTKVDRFDISWVHDAFFSVKLLFLPFYNECLLEKEEIIELMAVFHQSKVDRFDLSRIHDAFFSA